MPKKTKIFGKKEQVVKTRIQVYDVGESQKSSGGRTIYGVSAEEFMKDLDKFLEEKYGTI